MSIGVSAVIGSSFVFPMRRSFTFGEPYCQGLIGSLASEGLARLGPDGVESSLLLLALS
jgi:hypothetical protein